MSMIHHPVLVNGEWREASYPVSSFKAVSPLSGRQLPDSFPVSSFLDIDEMLQADESDRCAIEKVSFEKRAKFLELIAEEISKNSEELCQTAHSETGLSLKPYLIEAELVEMLQQLRQAADFCLNRTWREVTIDAPNNIRSFRGPLSGPVIIFGPANMPFSRNSCGGADFACAITAGNSVIAKSNPNHPLTSLKLAKIINLAASQLDMPRCLFQFFFHTTVDLGFRLASHPMIGAIAFTGSKKAGLALRESADHAGNMAFMNMTGLNPVLLLPNAINERKSLISKDICDAVLGNDGQSCQKPGLFFLVENKESSNLIRSVVDEFNVNHCKPLLTDLVARNLDSMISGFIRLGARKLTKKEFYQPNPFIYPNTVLHIDIKTWLKFASQFQEEAFGPVTIFITLENDSQFASILKTLESSASISIYSHESGADDPIYTRLEPPLRRKTAHLINDRMPTSARTHTSIKRFTTAQHFHGFKTNRLPADLQG